MEEDFHHYRGSLNQIDGIKTIMSFQRMKYGH